MRLAGVNHSDAETGDDVHIAEVWQSVGVAPRLACRKLKARFTNAVVTKDVSPRLLAASVPARIVRKDIDIDALLYHKRVVEE